MRARPERMLAGLLAVGLVVRLAFTATTDGNTFDLNSYVLARDALLHGPGLEMYGPELLFEPLQVHRWPYPPGFLPVLLAVGELSDLTGISMQRLVRLPSIAADLAIAWLVFEALRGRLGSDRALVGAAAVALGPSFIALSGHHGQIDAVAVAPVVAAVVLWERDVARRWLWCGLLIGLGAAVKAPLGVLVLALLPTARDLREAVRVGLVALAVPLTALAPFLAVDLAGVRDSLSYAGLPGAGGLSLLAQPDTSTFWLSGEPLTRSGLTDLLQDVNAPMAILAALASAALLGRRRASASVTAVAIVLAVWVFGVNFSLGYALWGLPFLLLAGWVRAAWVLQALLLVPTLTIYLTRTVDGWPRGYVLGVFVPMMIVALGAWLVAWAWLVSGRGRGPFEPAPGAPPPGAPGGVASGLALPPGDHGTR